MTRALLLVLLALVAAPPARAQLGIDLGGQREKKDAQKKPDAKKKQDKKKAEKKKPERAGPAKPKTQRQQPPAPVPSPETRPAPVPSPAPPPETRPAPVPSPAPSPETRPAPAPAPRPEGIPEPPPPLAPPPPAPPRPARKEKPQQQPGLTLTPLDEKASGGAKARLDAAKKLLDDKAPEAAALAFDQIVRDPKLASVHDEARYQRAKALARLGLDFSALTAFDEVLDRGPSGTRFFHTAMEWLFWIGRRLPNEQPLLTRVARYASQGVPPAYEDRVNYVLARYEFDRGRALSEAGRAGEAKAAWAEARRLASRVREEGGAPAAKVVPATKVVPNGSKDAPAPENGDVYARARFVDGLIAYAEGNDAGATELFKEVVRLTNPKKARTADPDLRELAFLQLARIHYQNRQNRYALFYYGKMPWGGQRWLEGLWEASWAHYRIGDYEKTLGNLITLQSPYFRDEYFPESYVLKAIVYYENCRYPEARQVLEQFSSIYDPVYSELTLVTARARTPDAYYELVRGGAAAGGAAKKILKLSETDQNVARLVESIGAMEREMDVGLGGRRPEFRQSALGKELHDKLAAGRAVLVEEAGQRMRAKLEYERDQLRQLLAQALRIQIEVSRKEREALEGSLAKGSQVDVVRDLKYSHAVSDEHLYWPYEGEFWRDELGTYSYTLTKGCKDRLPRARPAGR
jgi:tetratricopeptide (TPR) repeat protein